MAVSPDGESVYVTNAESRHRLQYDVGAGGTLTPKTPATVAAGTSPDAVAVSPDGESVFVANFNRDNVSQYDVGAGGTLTPKSPATVAAGFSPTALAVTPAPRVPTKQRAVQERRLAQLPAVQEPGAVHRVRQPRLVNESGRWSE